MSINLLNGIPVYLDRFEQNEKITWARRPRSKCKRIRNKWWRDPKNWKMTPIYTCFQTPMGFLMNRTAYERLLEQIEVKS